MRNKYIRWGLVFLAFFLVSTGVYLSSVVIGAAAIDEKKLIMSETTEIYDTNGQKFADLYIEDREMIDIEEVPAHVKQAFMIFSLNSS